MPIIICGFTNEYTKAKGAIWLLENHTVNEILDKFLHAALKINVLIPAG